MADSKEMDEKTVEVELTSAVRWQWGDSRKDSVLYPKGKVKVLPECAKWAAESGLVKEDAPKPQPATREAPKEKVLKK